MFPTDGPCVLTGGFGLICLVNKAPHPNAAKLFVNWFAGHDGQEAYSQAMQAPSLRTDLTYNGLPAYVFPRKGVKYMDTYGWKFVTGDRDAAFTKVRELLAQ